MSAPEGEDPTPEKVATCGEQKLLHLPYSDVALACERPPHATDGDDKDEHLVIDDRDGVRIEYRWHS